MILQFEWSGTDTPGSGYTYKLQTPLNFTKLILKSVAVYKLGGDGPEGHVPLYLAMDFPGQNHALLSPAEYEDDSGRVNDVDNERIALGDMGFTQPFDLTLIDGETHFEHGKKLSFDLQFRSVSEEGELGSIQSLGEGFAAMRAVVTMETVGGSQEPQTES
jgi:hypothetical protein